MAHALVEFDEGDIDVLEVLDELTLERGSTYSVERAVPPGARASVDVVGGGRSNSTVASSRQGNTVITFDRHDRERVVTFHLPDSGAPPPFVTTYSVQDRPGAGVAAACLEAVGKDDYTALVPRDFAGILVVEWA